jgi:hypothetical protein
VVSVRQTEYDKVLAGEQKSAGRPISDEVEEYLRRVDWVYADQACGASWGNRVFFAVPLKGSSRAAGTPVRNDGLLVYNLLNQGWEGLWTGPTLEVMGFARHLVNGEERLTFANADGQVCWLHDGADDMGVHIETELVTRGYGGQIPGQKLYLAGQVRLAVAGAAVTILARMPGVAEETTLVTKVYDRSKSLVYGVADYDPTNVDGRLEEPHREDYSLAPGSAGIDLGTEGLLVDAKQQVTEELRMREKDNWVQLVIRKTVGEMEVLGTTLSYVSGGGTGSRRS